MADDGQIRRLRKERNLAAVTAAALLGISMLVSVPRALKMRAELKRTNDELIGLQAELGTTNQKIVDAQVKIRNAQAEIERLLKSAH